VKIVLSSLNKEQKTAVIEPGSVLLTACPGSGKTRVLTYKLIYELDKLMNQNSKRFVLALTFTNRAAEEIKSRIDKLYVSSEQLWSGTIHSFCLEWILKPYAGYCERIKDGYVIIDESRKKRGDGSIASFLFPW